MLNEKTEFPVWNQKICCVLHEDWSFKTTSMKQSCCPSRLILDNAQEQLKVFSWHSFLIASVVQGHRYKPLVSLDSFTKITTQFIALCRNLGKNKGRIFQIQVFKVSLLNPSSDTSINSLLCRSAERWLFMLTLLETVCARCISWWSLHRFSYGLAGLVSGAASK